MSLFRRAVASFHVRSPRQKPLPFLIFLKIGTLIDLGEKIRLLLVSALQLKRFWSYVHLKFARNIDFLRSCPQLTGNISASMTLREVI